MFGVSPFHLQAMKLETRFLIGLQGTKFPTSSRLNITSQFIMYIRSIPEHSDSIYPMIISKSS